jgi:hypothetical protein
MLDRFLDFFLSFAGRGARPGGGILLNSQTQSNTRFFRVRGRNAHESGGFRKLGPFAARGSSPFARLVSRANGRGGE